MWYQKASCLSNFVSLEDSRITRRQPYHVVVYTTMLWRASAYDYLFPQSFLSMALIASKMICSPICSSSTTDLLPRLPALRATAAKAPAPAARATPRIEHQPYNLQLSNLVDFTTSCISYVF